VYQIADSCVLCPEGTYSTLASTECLECEAGYLCYGGTNRQYPSLALTHFGEPCPKGHYCPLGSSEAVACPAGTYNDVLGAAEQTECLLCDAESYNDLEGESGCRPCGAYAAAAEGATSCTCLGAERVFSETDSSCRCKSGYDYVDEDGVHRGQESATEDCTPLVFDRCEGEDETRGPDGACVGLDDCSVECGEAGGVRSETLGVCTCADDLGVDEVCNQQCRASAD